MVQFALFIEGILTLPIWKSSHSTYLFPQGIPPSHRPDWCQMCPVLGDRGLQSSGPRNRSGLWTASLGQTLSPLFQRISKGQLATFIWNLRASFPLHHSFPSVWRQLVACVFVQSSSRPNMDSPMCSSVLGYGQFDLASDCRRKSPERILIKLIC